MELNTENKKRGAGERNKTKRDWAETAISISTMVLATAAGAFLSGLAASAGAATWRNVSGSSETDVTANSMTVVPMKKVI